MKNLIKYAIVCLMTLAFSCSYSQYVGPEQPVKKKPKKFKTVKIFSNSDFSFKTDKSSGFLNLLRTFSPAISWGNEYRNFHEIGIQNFGLMLWDNSRQFNSLVSYSYNLKMQRYNPNRKVNFYSGLGIQVGGMYRKQLPISAREYSTGGTRLNFNLVFTPRMTVKLSKRAFLDISFPYSIYSKTRYSYFNENPSLPVEDRKRSLINSNTFPNQFTVQVGVAIKF